MRLMIVDNNDEYRSAIKVLLADIDHVEVIGEASDGESFLEQLQVLCPDVVLIDIELPVINGITATRKAMDMCRMIKIIAVSGQDNNEYLRQIIEAGAQNYILK